MEKEYEIWMEGYAATGEHSGANFIGKSKGEDFNDACRKYFNGSKLRGTLDLDKDGNFRYNRPSVWACRLFDNAADARKSFG